LFGGFHVAMTVAAVAAIVSSIVALTMLGAVKMKNAA
jgi:hypothetical protein